MMMLKDHEVNENTEIRRALQCNYMTELIQILDRNQGWKILMSSISLNHFDLDDSRMKYNLDDMKTIENAGTAGRSCTELFLEEWATSGPELPTMKLLRDYLIKLELLRAANYITVEILKEESLRFDSLSEDSRSKIQSNENNEEALADIGEIREKYKDLKEISYEKIKTATDNFKTKYKLGKGASGTVYFGKIDGEELAIKVLNSYTTKHFENELKILSQFVNHSKLLPPVGISFSNSRLCVVYPFMPNGSLKDRLALQNKKESPLTWQKRVSISLDIIEGLEYLHYELPKVIVHGDIKSSNILLDSNDTAKIGDFGLVRVKNQNNSVSYTSAKGTEAYMAPEVLAGNITAKADIYSYGMVLLELMTGLPIQSKDAYSHLMYYLQDEIGSNGISYLSTFLDQKAGTWNLKSAEKLYSIATECFNLEYKKRPDSVSVRTEIEKLQSGIESTALL